MIDQGVLEMGELVGFERAREVLLGQVFVPVHSFLVAGRVGAEGGVVEVGAVVNRVGRDDDGEVAAELPFVLFHHAGEHGGELIGELRQPVPRGVGHQDRHDRDVAVAMLEEGNDGLQRVLAAVHGVVDDKRVFIERSRISSRRGSTATGPHGPCQGSNSSKTSTFSRSHRRAA